MIGVKGSSFGRTGGFERRYPGGTECLGAMPSSSSTQTMSASKADALGYMSGSRPGG